VTFAACANLIQLSLPYALFITQSTTITLCCQRHVRA